MLKRIIVTAACLALGACKSHLPDSEVVAKVNDQPITKKDFEEQVERNMARYRGQAQQLPPGIEARIQESVLRRMVDDEIIAQKAKALQLTVTDQEVEGKYKEHKDRFRSDQAFDDYLKRSNNTEAVLKDDLRRSLLRDRVVEKLSGNMDVTEQDVEKYYTENAARFREAEQVRARRIVVRLPQPATPAEKKAKLKEAQKLRAQVTKPGADFAKLAREHSDGPEAPKDGDMGGFFARGHMPPDFDTVAFALKPEQISEVSETHLGYEIIQVQEKKPERLKPLEEVKDNIRTALTARLRNDRRRDVLRDLKNGAKVETLIKFDAGGPPPGVAPAANAPPIPGAPGSVPPGGAPAPSPSAPGGPAMTGTTPLPPGAGTPPPPPSAMPQGAPPPPAPAPPPPP